MQRRRDRGEWDVLVAVFLGCVAIAVFAVGTAIREIAPDIKRIADAVCVEAPPAEPVKEK